MIPEKPEKKKILLVSPLALFPTRMMAQVRIINLLKILNRDHVVDVAFIYRGREEAESCEKDLKPLCRKSFPLEAVNPRDSFLARKYHGLKHLFLHYLAGYSRQYLAQNNSKIRARILRLLAQEDYDILHVEYWYLGGLFKHVPGKIFKVIDSHAMVEENRESFHRKKGDSWLHFFDYRMFKRSIKQQRRLFRQADLVAAISRQGLEVLNNEYPEVKGILAPIGQDIEHFSSYPTAPEPDTLIFYGTLGSQQNSIAFMRLWERIMPPIRARLPQVKLLVVGSNPPENVRALHDGDKVVVTGYVDDPRQWLARARVMILPLETGSGFRGRVVEVMAMGLPVVGTHNALDSIEMTNGVHGFISDGDGDLAVAALRLLTDVSLWNNMSAACRKFAADHYSNEATVGNLSKLYYNLPKPKSSKER